MTSLRDVTAPCAVPVVTSLAENNAVGGVVATVFAVDRDRGLNGHVTHSLSPANISRWLVSIGAILAPAS